MWQGKALPASVQSMTQEWPWNSFLTLGFFILVSFFLIAVSVAEYFPAAEAQKGWRHLGREIVTS